MSKPVSATLVFVHFDSFTFLELLDIVSWRESRSEIETIWKINKEDHCWLSMLVHSFFDFLYQRQRRATNKPKNRFPRSPHRSLIVVIAKNFGYRVCIILIFFYSESAFYRSSRRRKEIWQNYGTLRCCDYFDDYVSNLNSGEFGENTEG
jgi:hypothetical protein